MEEGRKRSQEDDPKERVVKINLNMDVARLITRFERMEKPLVFAAVNTINGTARDIQEAEKDEIKRDVTIRRPAFTLREIAIIKPFANVKQGRLFAEVSVGRKKRSLLAQLVDGGVKEHKGKNVAIPVTGGAARPTFQTAQEFPPLVQQLRFKKPRRKRGGKPGAKVILQGPDGTFLIPGVAIRKREGDHIQTLIVYKPVVRIPKTVRWREIAGRVGAKSMRERMEIEVIKVIGRRG